MEIRGHPGADRKNLRGAEVNVNLNWAAPPVSGNRKFKAAKDKREAGGFVPLPHAVIRSQSFSRLSAHAVKLLIELLAQYKGDNNGDLQMTWNTMSKRGWASRDTLNKARNQLMETNFILVARQGGRHRCSLYAVTFYAIDECKGKLDISATVAPPKTWRRYEPAPTLRAVAR